MRRFNPASPPQIFELSTEGQLMSVLDPDRRGLTLEVEGASTTPETKVVMTQKSKNAHQKWAPTFDGYLESKLTEGMCMCLFVCG